MSTDRNHFLVSESSPEYPRKPALLEEGMRMDADEFLRRYERMPEIKKAELIQGVVYMQFFVSASWHGRQDGRMQTWLGYYAAGSKNCELLPNSTVRLGHEDVPQPDTMLRLLPEFDGQSTIDNKGCVAGAPELVAEIVGTSKAHDLKEKLATYRRFGIPEYITWQTKVNEIAWRSLENGEYRLLATDADGIIRSRIFPGLWLDIKAMLAGDMSRVLEVVQMGLKAAGISS